MGQPSGSGSKFNVFGSRTLVINYNIRSLGTQSYLFSEVEANGGLCGQGKPASTEPKGEAGLAYKTEISSTGIRFTPENADQPQYFMDPEI